MSSQQPSLHVLFTAPQTIAIDERHVPTPSAGQVLVKSTYSAISAGTELLFYRGQVPPQMATDATIDSTLNSVQTGEPGKDGVHYPLAYGYAVVGRVIELGAGVDGAWLDKRVFAFHPHASHFAIAPDSLIPIPDHISDEQALFLPNMETAVNFVHDGAPLLGERVVVLGMGVVGLLTATVLAHFPLAALIAVDRVEMRRQRARASGVSSAVADLAAEQTPLSADLVYELTGNPSALNAAINACAYSGRVVVGSWYGQKRAEIDLGGHFHRNRIQLISSQVSSIAPALQGRWDKSRRFETVWAMLASVDPTTLITHRLPVQEAATAYQRLDQQAADVMQIILTY